MMKVVLPALLALTLSTMAFGANFFESDPYKILGVSRSDDLRTIRRAFRAATRQYHPDKATNDQQRLEFHEKIKRILVAWENLKKNHVQVVPQTTTSKNQASAADSTINLKPATDNSYLRQRFDYPQNTPKQNRPPVLVETFLKKLSEISQYSQANLGKELEKLLKECSYSLSQTDSTPEKVSGLTEAMMYLFSLPDLHPVKRLLRTEFYSKYFLPIYFSYVGNEIDTLELHIVAPAIIAEAKGQTGKASTRSKLAKTFNAERAILFILEKIDPTVPSHYSSTALMRVMDATFDSENYFTGETIPPVFSKEIGAKAYSKLFASLKNLSNARFDNGAKELEEDEKDLSRALKEFRKGHGLTHEEVLALAQDSLALPTCIKGVLTNL